MVYVTHDLAVVGADRRPHRGHVRGPDRREGPAADGPRAARATRTRAVSLASIPDHAAPRRLRGDARASRSASASGRRVRVRAPLPAAHRRAATSAMPELEPGRPGHAVRCFEWQRTPELAARRAAPRGASRSAPAPRRSSTSSRSRAEHRGRGDDGRGGRRRLASTSRAASASRSSASRAAGRRRSRAASPGCTRRRRGTIRARRARPLAATARGRTRRGSAGASRSSSRTRATRSTRVTRCGDAIARPLRCCAALSARRRTGRGRRSSSSACACPRRLARSLSGASCRAASASESRSPARSRPQPDLLICDEITSALDVSVQAAVLELLAELRDELGLGLLFITHDLGVVASDRRPRARARAAARSARQGAVATLLAAPQHPYTRRLLAAAPSLAGYIAA